MMATPKVTSFELEEDTLEGLLEDKTVQQVLDRLLELPPDATFRIEPDEGDGIYFSVHHRRLETQEEAENREHWEKYFLERKQREYLKIRGELVQAGFDPDNLDPMPRP